jgi:7-carboxy-7-deazaguanine synthase
MLEISDIILTIQGEGIFQGIPSILIRFPKCNMKCRWCDATESMKHIEYIFENLKEFFDHIRTLKCDVLIFTGGEPLIHPEIKILTNEAHRLGYKVFIETNGTIFKDIQCDFMSISPKLKNSNPFEPGTLEFAEYEKVRLDYDVVNKFIELYDYQLKFVIKGDEDIPEIQEYLNHLNVVDKSRVLLMPLASDKDTLEAIQKDIIQCCIYYGHRYCNRLQLQVWGDDQSEKRFSQRMV